MTRTLDKKRPSAKLRYRKICTYIDRHLRREGAHAVGIQRTGKYILWVKRHGAFTFEKCDTFEEWRDQRLRFSPEWMRKYTLIGSTYTIAELRGKQLGVHALAAIAGMHRDYRETLLHHGQHHDTTVIRSAYKRARACGSLEEGLAMLRTLLGPPGQDAGKPRPAEQLTLTQHVTRLRRRLASLGREVQLVHRRIGEHDPIAADLRQDVRRDLRVAANALTTLEGALRDADRAEALGDHLH